MTLTQQQNVHSFEYTDDFTPNSSVVEKVFYDEPNERLAVGIKHGPHIYFYEYDGVPADEYALFKSARSAGRYYNWYIKGAFPRGNTPPEAPWGFSKYPDAPEQEQLAVHNAPPVASVNINPKDVVSVPKAKRAFELHLDVPAKVRVEADTLDEALSLFRAAPTDYVTLEVVGGNVVA